MFPKRNDPCRPSWWEDPDDDYDPGPDLYDDEVLACRDADPSGVKPNLTARHEHSR